ncbi:uncharacterized protein LOC133258958 [Bos javanicus]|uniref:uncharacterized protein LOC133258958 n=1 Tax=Bos javanicus TaxID=9906 RepID=UPI002AA926E4|nr:uncharacterized protein LOC133258958 [Bos javanicus]
MAASGSPGPPPSPCPGEAGQAPPPPAPRSGKGENELTSERSRRRRLRAGGVPGGRAGPGAAAAATAVPSAPLFPFREDPGKAEPGNQEVPRRDTSCRRYGNGPPPPRAAHPGPRLRAAGPARLTGRGQPSPLRPRPPPSWRGPGGPFPAARARCSRVFPPAAGARCQGCRVLAPLPRKRSQERPPGPRGRRERGSRRDCRARTWSGASSNCTKTTSFSWCPLAGRGMADTRGEVSRAVAESHGLCSQIASCFVSGSTTHQLSELGH